MVDVATGAPAGCGVVDLAARGADGFDGRRPALTAAGVAEVVDALPGMPACVWIEAPYAGRSGAVTVDLAMSVGATWQALTDALGPVPVSFVAPAEWKRAAGVPPDPRDGRRALKGAALRAAVADALETVMEAPHVAMEIRRQTVAGLKPWPMACAILAGFLPHGSQDAADAALIAVAGQRLNADRWATAAD